MRISGTLHYIVLITRSFTGIRALIARRLNSAPKSFAVAGVAILTLVGAAALVGASQQKTTRKPGKPPAPRCAVQQLGNSGLFRVMALAERRDRGAINRE